MCELWRIKMHHGYTRLHWVLVGWMPYHCSWKKMYYLGKNLRLTKYGGKLLGFGCLRTKNCTSVRSLGPTYYVCTQRHQRHFWRNCMRGFVEVILGEDHYLTGLLPKDIGGQTCKKRRMNMSGNVISARGLHQTFISLEGSLTLCLVHVLLLSGA